MADVKYTVSAPDGTKFSIIGPEDASPQELEAEAARIYDQELAPLKAQQATFQSPKYEGGQRDRTPLQVMSDQAASAMTGLVGERTLTHPVETLKSLPGAIAGGLGNLLSLDPTVSGPAAAKAGWEIAKVPVMPFVRGGQAAASAIEHGVGPDSPAWGQAAEAGGLGLSAAPVIAAAPQIGRQVGRAITSQIKDSPDALLVARFNIEPKFAKTALDELKASNVKVKDVDSALAGINARKEAIFPAYDRALAPVAETTVPGSRATIMNRELEAIPVGIKNTDPGLYQDIVKEIQAKHLGKPDLTIKQLDQTRSSLGGANSVRYAKNRTSQIAAEETFKAMDFAVEEAARDLFYRAVGQMDPALAEGLRGLNQSKGALIQLENSLKPHTRASYAARGRGLGSQVVGQDLGRRGILRSSVGRLQGPITGRYSDINKYLEDIMERWPGQASPFVQANEGLRGRPVEPEQQALPGATGTGPLFEESALYRPADPTAHGGGLRRELVERDYLEKVKQAQAQRAAPPQTIRGAQTEIPTTDGPLFDDPSIYQPVSPLGHGGPMSEVLRRTRAFPEAQSATAQASARVEALRQAMDRAGLKIDTRTISQKLDDRTRKFKTGSWIDEISRDLK